MFVSRIDIVASIRVTTNLKSVVGLLRGRGREVQHNAQFMSSCTGVWGRREIRDMPYCFVRLALRGAYDFQQRFNINASAAVLTD
jgi:hypothetical protein